VAEFAESAGDVATARRLLADAVAEDRQHPSALEELARIALRHGDARSALDALVTAAESSNVTTRKAQLLHRAAELAETRLDDVPGAIALLTRALSFDPERAETLDRAIALKQARGESIPEAWLAARPVVSEQGGGAGDSVLMRAELHRRAGQLDLALARLEEVLLAEPSHPGALRASLEIELEAGRPEQAMRHAKTLIEAAERDEDRLLAHMTMARLMDEHRGDVAGSAAHYSMALDLSPRDGALRGKLAAAKARLRDPSAGEELRKALDDLRRVIERRPDRPEGWDALVTTLAGCGFANPAATIEGVASALGTLAGKPHRHPATPLETSLVDRVAPRGMHPAAREFFVAAQRVLSALAPFQPDRWGAAPLDASHPLSRELAALGPLRILVSSRVPLACVPADADGKTIVLGRDVIERFAPDEIRFLAASAQAVAVAGLSPVVQLNRADLEKCVGAILGALEIASPSNEVARTGPFVDVAKRLIGTSGETLHAAASRLVTEGAFDAGTIADATARVGYRAALARLGDGNAAISALRKLYGVTATGGRELVEAVRAVPPAWDLVLFSMSPACIDARRKAGMAGR
jgi:tetratricopeptide (TPR) repeat protein